MTDLNALIERLARATGDSRTLDAMIHHLVRDGIGNGAYSDAPRYTSSIDAAMMLVPRGWIVEICRCFDDDGEYWTRVTLTNSFSVGRGCDPEDQQSVEAKGCGDLPRFICIAALSARTRTATGKSGAEKM